MTLAIFAFILPLIQITLKQRDQYRLCIVTDSFFSHKIVLGMFEEQIE